MESPGELPIVMITVDRGSDALVLVRSDGKEARLPLPGPLFEPTSLLSRVSYPPTFEGLVVETLKSDSIVFELPRPDRADQLSGRLVVYLDQNKWGLVSDAMRGQRSGTVDDRVAASGAFAVMPFYALDSLQAGRPHSGVVQAMVPTISSTISRVVSGWRKANRATVAPSQPVGATNAVWPASKRADHSA